MVSFGFTATERAATAHVVRAASLLMLAPSLPFAKVCSWCYCPTGRVAGSFAGIAIPCCHRRKALDSLDSEERAGRSCKMLMKFLSTNGPHDLLEQIDHGRLPQPGCCSDNYFLAD